MSEDGELLSSKNVPKREIDTKAKLDARLKTMESYNRPIEINIPNEGTAYMYYENSVVQKMLQNFPIFLSCAIGLFALLIYVVVSTNNKTEQNKLWIGMSKETAHQLGTPISSLLGWVEVLREENQEIAEEIEKDVIRLEKVSTRFSKIGSIDDVYIIDTIDIIKNGISYANRRKATNITIIDKTGDEPILCKVNETLWEWVIENLLKNAIDAIGVEHGTITVAAQVAGTVAYFDFSDTGKGIPAKVYRRIFTPGYTTKSRGWGLGLSLCRRIVEDYYHGKIFVLQSETGKGTTMRVVLPIAG
jgi:signal transduction histidine kinase